jgi:hypothetical protein
MDPDPRILEAQKHADPADPVPDPKHCCQYKENRGKNEEDNEANSQFNPFLFISWIEE